MTNLEEVVWCQEEPKNQGYWFFIEDRLEATMAAAGVGPARPRYAGRAESASPATGLAKRHAAEQAALVENALGLDTKAPARRKAS
jgi:2-oxoglutarate dehydrogenase E1 component